MDDMLNIFLDRNLFKETHHFILA